MERENLAMSYDEPGVPAGQTDWAQSKEINE